MNRRLFSAPIVAFCLVLLSALMGCQSDPAWTAGPANRVSYDGNGNTGGTAPTDGSTYGKGATVTVQGNPGLLVKGTASPLGWNTEANGGGDFHAFGSSLTMGGADITLYAVWATTAVDSLPFSLTATWTHPEAGDYQFKVVKSTTSAAIDTYAKVDALAGADVVLDWTTNATQAIATGLRSNTTYCLAIAARKGSSQYLYPILSAQTTSIAFPNVVTLPSGDLMFAYKDTATSRGKIIVYGTDGLPKTRPVSFYVNNYTLADTWKTKYDLKVSAAGVVYIGHASGDGTRGCYYTCIDSTGAWLASKIISPSYNAFLYGPELAINGDRVFYYTAGNWSGTNQGSQYGLSKVSDYTTLKFPTQVEIGDIREIRGIAACGVGTSENFIAFDSAEESNLDLYYSIYNNTGQVSKARAVICNTKSGTLAALQLGNHNAMIAYQDANDGNTGKVRVYDDSGALVAGPVSFGITQDSLWMPMVNTGDGRVLIAFCDGTDGGKAKYVLLNTDGSLSMAATALTGSAALPVGATHVAAANKVAIVYKDAAAAVYWYDFLNGL